jgi:hypothetical protein
MQKYRKKEGIACRFGGGKALNLDSNKKNLFHDGFRCRVSLLKDCVRFGVVTAASPELQVCTKISSISYLNFSEFFSMSREWNNNRLPPIGPL